MPTPVPPGPTRSRWAPARALTKANTVSVGSGNGIGGPATRRIVNVSEGLDATDAVNKSQLDAVSADTAAATSAFKANGDAVATASGIDSTAAGAGATASGARSAASGAGSTASAIGGSAVGVDSLAIGTNSTAVGRQTNVIGENGVALGYNSFVRQSGKNGVAVGANAGASGADSVAIGSGSRTYDANVVSFGSGNGVGGPATRKLTNVGAGDLAKGSTDAINGGQFFQSLSNSISFLGGRAALGAQGVFVAPTYAIQGASYNTVGDALSALDSKVSASDAATASATPTSAPSARMMRSAAVETLQAAAPEAIATEAATDAARPSPPHRPRPLQRPRAPPRWRPRHLPPHPPRSAPPHAPTDVTGTAIGGNAYAHGPNDTAIGSNTRVDADGSTAIGANAHVACRPTATSGSGRRALRSPRFGYRRRQQARALPPVARGIGPGFV